jgi:peptidoglycan/xylan/chitin deacetylase (PgdA/CDA1 family)
MSGESSPTQAPSEPSLAQQPETLPPSGEATASFPKSGIPVLMYHSISTDEKNSLCVSEDQFKGEMEWLHQNAYHTISIDEFYEALMNQGSVPENPILITFDDGYTDNFTTAWPILKEYGFTATFFIITDYVSPSRIEWEQLSELVEQGNSIGSHTIHHYDLSKLSAVLQKKEIADSKSILDEKLDVTVKAFCYPSGKYNQTTLKLLSESGYSLGFSTKSGRVHAGDDPLLLKRVRIWGGMTSTEFIKQVSQ